MTQPMMILFKGDLDYYFANNEVVEGVFDENIDDGVDTEIEDEDHDIENDDLDGDADE